MNRDVFHELKKTRKRKKTKDEKKANTGKLTVEPCICDTCNGLSNTGAVHVSFFVVIFLCVIIKKKIKEKKSNKKIITTNKNKRTKLAKTIIVKTTHKQLKDNKNTANERYKEND